MQHFTCRRARAVQESHPCGATSSLKRLHAAARARGCLPGCALMAAALPAHELVAVRRDACSERARAWGSTPAPVAAAKGQGCTHTAAADWQLRNEMAQGLRFHRAAHHMHIALSLSSLVNLIKNFFVRVGCAQHCPSGESLQRTPETQKCRRKITIVLQHSHHRARNLETRTSPPRFSCLPMLALHARTSVYICDAVTELARVTSHAASPPCPFAL